MKTEESSSVKLACENPIFTYKVRKRTTENRNPIADHVFAESFVSLFFDHTGRHFADIPCSICIQGLFSFFLFGDWRKPSGRVLQFQTVMLFFWRWLFAHQPHIKCIRLGSVRSSHLPCKMHYVRSSLHVISPTGE